MEALFKEELVFPSEEVWISGELRVWRGGDLDLRGSFHLECSSQDDSLKFQ